MTASDEGAGQRLRGRSLPRCPLCREALEDPALRLTTCAPCETAYHELCFDELGGCSTLGCAGGRRRGPERFVVPPKRLEEIRRRIAAEQAAWRARARPAPDGIRVERGEEDLTLSFQEPFPVPWFGLLFLHVWVVGMGAAVVDLTSDGEHAGAALFGLFAALGALGLYALWANWANRHFIRVDRRQLRCFSRPFPLPGASIRLPLASIHEVRFDQEPDGDDPDQPFNVLTVVHGPARRERVIHRSKLSEEQCRYLQHELQRWLAGEDSGSRPSAD
jgi:hypothetical protein